MHVSCAAKLRQMAAIAAVVIGLSIGFAPVAAAETQSRQSIDQTTSTLSFAEAYETIASVGMGEKNMPNMPHERVNYHHVRITITGPSSYTIDAWKSCCVDGYTSTVTDNS